MAASIVALGKRVVLHYRKKKNFMGFNELMHPKNVYRKSSPDLQILAETFEYFRRFVKESSSGHCTLNRILKIPVLCVP